MRAVHRRLAKAQGAFTPKPRRPVIDELIQTVLSQATSDVNSGRAFEALKDRFGSWQEVAGAPVDEVADAIRAGGIADVKAARIQAILRDIEAREGAIDLSRLTRLGDGEVSAYLCSLPGVGLKTAACVMAFSLGRDAFPVDTHVHRIAKRLGWVGSRTGADRTQREVEPLVPRELRYEFHLQLIRHGREVCTARSPLCTRCVLLDMCDAGPRLLATRQAR